MNESYQKLWDDAKKYLQLRYDLMRVELLEKTSQIASILLTIIVALLLGIIIFTYLSALLLFWLKTIFGSFIPGLCIVLGIHLILLVLVIVFRKQWFLRSWYVVFVVNIKFQNLLIQLEWDRQTMRCCNCRTSAKLPLRKGCCANQRLV